MGIVDRVERLINSPIVSESQAEQIVECFKVLVDKSNPSCMGSRFKVLAISSKGIDLPGFSSN